MLQSPVLIIAGSSGHREVVNANGSASSSMGQGASRMAKALQYKQAKLQHTAPNDKAATTADAEQSSGLTRSPAEQTVERVRPSQLCSFRSSQASCRDAYVCKVGLSQMCASNFQKLIVFRGMSAPCMDCNLDMES